MFNSKLGRTVYRFLEIFVIAGLIGLIRSPELQTIFQNLDINAGIALGAALVKGYREVKG